MMPEFLTFIWDDCEGGNIEHLAEHGVTPAEAEEVVCRYLRDRERSRTWPEYWVVFGYTAADRFLMVVFEYDGEQAIVCVVTAYEPEGN